MFATISFHEIACLPFPAQGQFQRSPLPVWKSWVLNFNFIVITPQNFQLQEHKLLQLIR